MGWILKSFYVGFDTLGYLANFCSEAFEEITNKFPHLTRGFAQYSIWIKNIRYCGVCDTKRFEPTIVGYVYRLELFIHKGNNFTISLFQGLHDSGYNMEKFN